MDNASKLVAITHVRNLITSEELPTSEMTASQSQLFNELCLSEAHTGLGRLIFFPIM